MDGSPHMGTNTHKYTHSHAHLLIPQTHTLTVCTLTHALHPLRYQPHMQVCHAEDPGDICSAKISNRGLNRCDVEDLIEFKNLVHIDCAENELDLELFAT